jgi:threonine-phosphate decarboxylase
MVTRLVSPVHGGDLSALLTRYGHEPAWIDFSANLNPWGPPPAVLTALQRCIDDRNALIEYPTHREHLLRKALAEHHALVPEQIVLANGAAALIEAFVRTVAPQRCVLPQPAFSEYARALQAEHTTILPFFLAEDRQFKLDTTPFLSFLADEQPDACILTNPHNPSGALIALEDLERIVDCCKHLRIALLLDEAFIDYSPDASILALHTDPIAYDRLFVLRSLTKFYGMAGLRVGYGIAAQAFAAQLTLRIPSWPMSAPAIDAAIAAIHEQAYAEAARSSNLTQRTELAKALEQIGLRVFPSAANFLLVALPCATTTATTYLAEYHHIAVRDCSSYSFETAASYIRIAVRSAEENTRIIAALTELLIALTPVLPHTVVCAPFEKA